MAIPGSFVIGAAYHFIGNVLATMTATMALSLATMTATIWQGSLCAPNIAISWQPISEIHAGPIPGISKKTPIKSNHCQLPECVGNDMATMGNDAASIAGTFAREMSECELTEGQTFTWPEIQKHYRIMARNRKWPETIANRYLSVALKNAGCVRGQADLRKIGRGRPITITFPTRDA